MRFKKGSTVEVMDKKEATTWRVAEIVSGNGHSYSVRYRCSSGWGKDMGLEKVSRKVIKPCPPPPRGVQNWAAGDIVEVFGDNSWITATVLKVLGGDHVLVSPWGLSQELSVHKLHIRMRNSWKDNQWVSIGKSSRSSGHVKYTKMANSNHHQALDVQVPLVNARIEHQGCCYNLPVLNDIGQQEAHIISSRTPTRASPFCSSLLEACPRKSKKFKATEDEGRSRTRRMVPDQLLDKVDAFAYPREILGDKFVQESFNNSISGFYEMEKGTSNGVVGCSLARISGPNDSDTDLSSVGSCSVASENPYKFSSPFLGGTYSQADTLSSEAESFHTSWNEEDSCSPPEEEVAASIHSLELEAYRSTLEALYASGPLSWEKEALLTNLRINLHISNDEHLTELRNLISPRAGFHD